MAKMDENKKELVVTLTTVESNKCPNLKENFWRLDHLYRKVDTNPHRAPYLGSNIVGERDVMLNATRTISIILARL